MNSEIKGLNLDKKKILEAKKKFIDTGSIRKGIVRDEILDSWKRCRSYSLDPDSDKNISGLTDNDKNKILSKNRALIEAARPFLENLCKVISKNFYELVGSLGLVVYLTDKDCVIIYANGDGRLWEHSRTRILTPGANLQEKTMGTNPVAMAVALDMPYQMIAEEHYIKLPYPASCAAAPIHDEDGEIIGALDVNISYEIAQKHPYAMAMILSGARVIESQLRLQKEFEKSFIANQYFNAAIESIGVGFVILNTNNIVTHVNPLVVKILGMSSDNIINRNIEDIIKNKDILDAIQKRRKLINHEVIFETGDRVHRSLVSFRHIFDTYGKVMGNVIFLRELAEVQKMVQQVVGFEAQYTFQDILGESEEILKAIEVAKTVAKGSANIIITGESGTGKELFAQSIHNASFNASGPFLGINCATIPNDLIESELFGYEGGTFTGGLRTGRSGKLEMANQGSLFLDEINGMPLSMQVKLLRVLEEKKFLRLGGKSYFKLNSKIIAATNKDLKHEIKLERFRSDLYYRLSTFEIYIPPLRERKGDIKFLAQKFMEDISVRTGKHVDKISAEAMRYLENYQWPGNVRELKNWVERAMLLARKSSLTLDDFSQDMSRGNKKNNLPLKSEIEQDPLCLDQMEMNTIKAALEECGGNISKACKRLGIGRASLYRKLRKYNFSFAKILSHGDS